MRTVFRTKSVNWAKFSCAMSLFQRSVVLVKSLYWAEYRKADSKVDAEKHFLNSAAIDLPRIDVTNWGTLSNL